MPHTSDFLLERVVHQVLKGDPGTSLFNEAVATGVEPDCFVADILFPAAECILQLHHDGSTTGRVLNSALRALRSLLESAAVTLPRPPQTARSLFVFTAPGESTDLGAHMLATLAESHGHRVFFAGAGLTLEELTFSIGQLAPDALVMHGALPGSGPRAAELIHQLRRIRICPSTQLVLTGALAPACPSAGADLVAHHPLEALELIALWPDYRHHPKVTKLPTLQMLDGATEQLGISTATIRQMIRRHFGKHDHIN